MFNFNLLSGISPFGLAAAARMQQQAQDPRYTSQHCEHLAREAAIVAAQKRNQFDGVTIEGEYDVIESPQIEGPTDITKTYVK